MLQCATLVFQEIVIHLSWEGAVEAILTKFVFQLMRLFRRMVVVVVEHVVGDHVVSDHVVGDHVVGDHVVGDHVGVDCVAVVHRIVVVQ